VFSLILKKKQQKQTNKKISGRHGSLPGGMAQTLTPEVYDTLRVMSSLSVDFNHRTPDIPYLLCGV
jgi:hypothetical protein